MWSRRILLNFCWVNIFFDILIANISWTVAQKTHIIFCHSRGAKKRYQLMDYVYCNSLLTRLWRHNPIFLIKPFFVNNQKVKTKIKLSWERKEHARWNKKQFTALNQIKQFFFGRWEYDYNVKTYWEPCKNKGRISIFLGCLVFTLNYSQPLGVPLFCHTIILK